VRRVVAITGASAGIGRATALRLARDGAALVICARRREPLDAAAGDIRREAEMSAFVATALDRFERLDVMICNAGFGTYGAIDRIEPARMRQLLDVNYMGTYLAAVRAELRGSGIQVTTVYPISTRTEFFDVMTRSSGFATRAQGPQQDASAVADAIARAIARPVAEVFPYRIARLLGIVNAVAPRLTDRLAQRWGRKPV
jgi:short-subunit dehydrogenase